MKKNIIVIIPARGGSKRFPRRNIQPLNGKPLVAYPIEAAKNVKLIDRVIVSTDNREIANVAKEYGAEIPFMRPKSIAGDVSPVIEAMIHMVMTLKEKENYQVDYAVLIQTTTPLITGKQIDRAVQIALDNTADSVISVAELDTPSHPYNIREIKENGTINFWQDKLHYEYFKKTKPKFYKAANIWLSSFKTLTKDRKLEGKRNFPLIVNALSALDIDYKEDLDFIESIMKLKK